MRKPWPSPSSAYRLLEKTREERKFAAVTFSMAACAAAPALHDANLIHPLRAAYPKVAARIDTP
jgi:hypothetical protein